MFLCFCIFFTFSSITFLIWISSTSFLKFGQHCQHLEKLLCSSALWRRNSTHKMQLLITGYKTQENIKLSKYSVSGAFHLPPDTQMPTFSNHNDTVKIQSHLYLLLREMYCLGLMSNWNIDSQGLELQMDFLFIVYDPWVLNPRPKGIRADTWELEQTPKRCSKIFYWSSNWEKKMCSECLQITNNGRIHR